MTEEEADQIGFPREWLPTDLTVEEAKINRCEVCGRIISRHPDARWRLSISPIRCKHCATIKRMITGRDWWQARYSP